MKEEVFNVGNKSKEKLDGVEWKGKDGAYWITFAFTKSLYIILLAF